MPQPAAISADTLQPQPLISSASFHELVGRLLNEYERALALNSDLEAELELIRGAEPPVTGLPDDVDEGDVTTVPASRVGRPALAAKQPASRLGQCLATWKEVPSADACTQTTVSPDGNDDEAGDDFSVGGGSLGEQVCNSQWGNSIHRQTPPRPRLSFQEKLKENEANLLQWGSSGTRETPPRPRLSIQELMAWADEFPSTSTLGESVKMRRLPSHGRAMTHRMTKLHRFLEDGDSGFAAQWYKFLMQGLLFVSICSPLAQMLEEPLLSERVGLLTEASFDLLFTLELLARLIVSPAPRVFFFKVFNLIDLLTPTTLILRLSLSFDTSKGVVDAAAIVLLCLTPIMRLLKMLRRWETMHLLAKAFSDVLEALPVLLFPLVVMTLSFAALIYMCESRDDIESLPRAMWLTIVTMTTVGYGDVVPKTTPGLIVVSFLTVISVMYMAMPVAILGSSFTRVWQGRDAEMLVHRTRERLAQWGYTANDIPSLFKTFDRDCSGGLNIPAFVRMIKTIKLGLNDEQILKLTRVFDCDKSGFIDGRDFVRVMFPSRYVEVYGSDGGDPDRGGGAYMSLNSPRASTRA